MWLSKKRKHRLAPITAHAAESNKHRKTYQENQRRKRFLRKKREEDFCDEDEDPRSESNSDESNFDESSLDERSSEEENSYGGGTMKPTFFLLTH